MWISSKHWQKALLSTTGWRKRHSGIHIATCRGGYILTEGTRSTWVRDIFMRGKYYTFAARRVFTGKNPPGGHFLHAKSLPHGVFLPVNSLRGRLFRGAISYRDTGNRRRGRPRRRWTDDIKQWTGISVADCVQRARDRSVWTVGILGVRVGDLRSSDMRKDLGKARLHKS